jgi:hypothetical protein
MVHLIREPGRERRRIDYLIRQNELRAARYALGLSQERPSLDDWQWR